MNVRFATLALCALSAAAVVRADDPMGAWSDVTVDDATSKMLAEAIKTEKNYADGVNARVCVAKITSIKKQVVQGINYKFVVQACEVEGAANAGMCADNKCESPKEMEIRVWEKVDNTVQITAVGPKSADDDVVVNAGSQAILGAGSPDDSDDATNGTANSAAGGANGGANGNANGGANGAASSTASSAMGPSLMDPSTATSSMSGSSEDYEIEGVDPDSDEVSGGANGANNAGSNGAAKKDGSAGSGNGVASVCVSAAALAVPVVAMLMQ